MAKAKAGIAITKPATIAMRIGRESLVGCGVACAKFGCPVVCIKNWVRGAAVGETYGPYPDITPIRMPNRTANQILVFICAN